MVLDIASPIFQRQVIIYLIKEYGISNPESEELEIVDTFDELLDNLEITLFERKRTEHVEGLGNCWISGKPLTKDAVHLSIPMQRLYPDNQDLKDGEIDSFSRYVNKDSLKKEIYTELKHNIT